MKDESAGLLAAILMGIVPGYISRSVAGSYDNEAIAIFLLMFTFWTWIRAMKQGSAFYGTIAAIFYFYMVAAWGGYVFITNMIPLHAFVLVLMGRFSSRLYVAYSSWYAVGTLASMQVPFVGFQPVRTSEHMAALGVFGLLQLVAFTELVRSHVSSKQFRFLLRTALVGVGIVGFVGDCRLDDERVDCSLDRSILLALGHWLRQEVSVSSPSFEYPLTRTQVHSYHRIGF
jgi:dolichyl-diphosphooligosaccharide--protein glycosyltransferase